MEKAEYETTITYDLEEKVVRLFSAIKRDQTKLSKAGFTPTYGTPARGFGYKVPLSRFRWRIAGTNPGKRGFNLRNARSTGPSTGRKGTP